MTAPKILFIVGSLRRGSFNHIAAEEAAKALAGQAETSFLDYTGVPFFNQDKEFPAPAAVVAVRKAVEQADGVWVFSAEYNGSYPGSLKNLLDWLGRPLDPAAQNAGSVIDGKKFAISSVSGASAGANVRGALTGLLGFKGQVLDRQTGLVLPGEAFMTGQWTPSEADKAALTEQAETFLGFLA